MGARGGRRGEAWIPLTLPGTSSLRVYAERTLGLPCLQWDQGWAAVFQRTHQPELVERAPPGRRDSVAQESQANTRIVPSEVDGVQWLICWRDSGTEEGRPDGRYRLADLIESILHISLLVYNECTGWLTIFGLLFSLA